MPQKSNSRAKANIELRLSSKVQKDTGLAEVLIRFFHGRQIELRAKTGIFISPDYFEYYINREKTEKLGIRVPANLQTITQAKAKEKGYVLRVSGLIVVNKRLETPEVRYHREQAQRVEDLKRAIIDNFNNSSQGGLTSQWLQIIIDHFMHPEKYIVRDVKKKTFYELVEEYIKKRDLAVSHARVFRVLAREVARYEGFVKATEYGRKNFIFDIDTVTRQDIEGFIDYLRNEYTLSQQHPKLFAKLLSQYPVSVTKGNRKVEDRGENTVIKGAKRLKSLFHWFYDEGMTKNRPFDGLEVGTEKVGTPYYISIEERNEIAETNLRAAYNQLSEADREGISKDHMRELEVQRDIFVFHCYVGCRVGDLLRLKPGNVTNDMLVYTPHKTQNNGEQAVRARVPLHPKAQELIAKYSGVDKDGRLFPFITAQKYNDAIKKIFTLCGITRNILIRNPKTGENELVPINTVASSHLARRTFIGNAYFKVSDPNIIGKMSGHVDGSRAFRRYRNIEDDTLRGVIDQIG